MASLNHREKKQIAEIQLLSNMLNQLFKDNSLSDEEVLPIIRKLCRTPLQEITKYRQHFLVQTDYIEKMISISNKYKHNIKILSEVIGCLGCLAFRYNTQRTTEKSKLSTKQIQTLFNFLLQYIDREEKEIQKELASVFPYNPLFLQYEHKWEFILSITNLKPKSDYMDQFRIYIEHYIELIPYEMKSQYLSILQNYLPKSHEAFRNDYIETINKLQEAISL